MTRKCKLCKERKSIKVFSINKNCTYGYEHICRICANERKNIWEKFYKEKWLKSFDNAKRRCISPTNSNYKDYGGRGIRFMLTKDETKYVWNRDNGSKLVQPSIDRIDPDGHYELSNIRFIELEENTRRRRHRRSK